MQRGHRRTPHKEGAYLAPSFFGFQFHFLVSQTRLILGLGQEIYKLSVDHLWVPKSNEVLKIPHSDGDMSKGQSRQLKELLMATVGMI